MALIRDLWNGLFAVGGAAGASQGPAFMQQYMQRLGGTIDGMKRAAESLEQVPPALVFQINTLTGHEAALQEASTLERPVVFVRTLDQRILEGTLATFEPAVPLTAEALVYGAAGMIVAILLGGLLAWLIAALLWRPWTRPRRRQDRQELRQDGRRRARTDDRTNIDRTKDDRTRDDRSQGRRPALASTRDQDWLPAPGDPYER